MNVTDALPDAILLRLAQVFREELANGYSRQSSAEANRNNLVSGLRDSHPDAEIIVEDFA